MTVDTSFLMQRRLRTAAAGCGDAAYDLGVAFSTGTEGAALDLIEAHKWFNLAAVAGHEGAPATRQDIAEEMTAREIATAQRAARDFLQANRRRAA